MMGNHLHRRDALRMAGAAALVGLIAPSRLFAAAAAPELAGNLQAFARKWVGPGKLPGLVVALGLPGRETRYIAQGSQGFIDNDAMGPDTLFRIYSMTKPVTGMAAMLLVDEGKLKLDQPIADFLPKFAKMNVQVTPDGSVTEVRPAKTLITVRHLITHTSGLPYGIVQQGPIREVLLTRRGNTVYVHLYRDPVGEAVKLKPLAVAPRKATLLNTGESVDFAVELVPSDHVEHKPYLRLRGLPVNEWANSVLVVKLEFEDLPAGHGQGEEEAEAGDLRRR